MLVYQDLDSYFGNRLFTGKERRLYGNLIFQDNIFNTRHTLKGGLDANSFRVSQQMWENDGSYDGLLRGFMASTVMSIRQTVKASA